MGTWWLALLAGVLLMLPVAGAASNTPVVTVTHADGTLTVTPLVAYDHLSLRVATPDGRLFQTEGSGGPIHFRPFAIADYTPPDGSYIWELHLMPRGAISAEVVERARRGRESGDVEAEQAFSAAARRAVVVRSGGFLVVGGKLVMGDGTEGRARSRGQSRGTILSPFGPAGFAGEEGLQLVDQVIPDDLIVQSSLCVGFDCVNNENFGFDTIRLKENNLRIKFEDTSVGAFPSNDWQLTANDSASGGLNRFSIEDVTGARTPFTVLAGAPTNSFFLDSLGRAGFRTSTPVLDLHAATSNTPAIRLEQNSSGGFSAQTWDVGANEANFFVRDVTGGSRLSFRIRPGAPTSSLDIAGDGDVGIGTQSPQQKVHVFGGDNVSAPNDTNTMLLVANTTVGVGTAAVLRAQSDVGTVNFQAHASNRVIARFGQVLGGWTEALAVTGNGLAIGTLGATPLIIGTNNADRIHILSNGNIGMGQAAPVHPLQMASGAHVTAGGVWTDVSSREAKDDIQSLTADEARTTLAALEPVKFAYKADPAERHVGFVAEDVPDLVARPDRKTLSPMDIVAVLTRVVQEQQQRIEELTAKLTALEGARGR
jgi:hypothetical protein